MILFNEDTQPHPDVGDFTKTLRLPASTVRLLRLAITKVINDCRQDPHGVDFACGNQTAAHRLERASDQIRSSWYSSDRRAV